MELKGSDLGWFNTSLQLLENPVKSYVYFALAESKGFEPLVKIGLSINVQRRMDEIWKDLHDSKYKIDWLETGIDTLRILGIVEGTQPLETALHRAFNKYAAGREWFWYQDGIADLIDCILSDYCVCESCLHADKCDAIHIPYIEITGVDKHEDA